MPLYDSAVDSHAHRLSFPPTLLVVGALVSNTMEEAVVTTETSPTGGATGDDDASNPDIQPATGD